MTESTPVSAVRLTDETVQELRQVLPGVAERTVAAIIEEVPSYSDALSGPMGETIKGAVETALGGFVQLASRAGGETPRAEAVEGAYQLGRGEARSGRTVDALLSAYRIGARVSWRELSAAAVRSGVDADTLAPLRRAGLRLHRAAVCGEPGRTQRRARDHRPGAPTAAGEAGQTAARRVDQRGGHRGSRACGVAAAADADRGRAGRVRRCGPCSATYRPRPCRRPTGCRWRRGTATSRSSSRTCTGGDVRRCCEHSPPATPWPGRRGRGSGCGSRSTGRSGCARSVLARTARST